jgi:predicted RNA binding protein YcfA (HicA-like mRNA interferase family)
MKRKVLEKTLVSLKCTFYKHGGSHDAWKTQKGDFLWIPRHSEINDFTAMAIIRQASK